MNISELETGDIVLVSHTTTGIMNMFLNLIKYGTHSTYTHIGMIVKDPQFLDTPLTGIYLWESSSEETPDPQDNKYKIGVQLTHIDDIINNDDGADYYVRRLKDNSVFENDVLKDIHKHVYNVPYDLNPIDWIMAFFRKDITPQKTNRFWCSAFVGYIYTKCGVLKKSIDWSILYPCDFALDGERLDYVDKEINSLEPVQYKMLIK